MLFLSESKLQLFVFLLSICHCTFILFRCNIGHLYLYFVLGVRELASRQEGKRPVDSSPGEEVRGELKTPLCWLFCIAPEVVRPLFFILT